jgi:hypothetical protein
MTQEKEKGAVPFETTPSGTTAPNQSNTASPQREGPRPEYHPLTWRAEHEKRAKLPRGKGRRDARRAAVQAKRMQSGVGTFDLIANIALVGWLAAVAVWAWEALS